MGVAITNGVSGIGTDGEGSCAPFGERGREIPVVVEAMCFS